jgi:phosphodiesterase/alkaline phosphatase D-like protein
MRNAGAHATNISFTFNLSGLTPGTLYHYTLVATNSAGATTGRDQTFTTLSPLPPVVSTGGTSGVTVKTAVIGGTVNAGGAPTTFSFQYGATSSYGAQTRTKNAGAANSDKPVSVSVSGLTSGTIYHYRIVASNSSGTTSGDDETFATTAAPAPTAVTGATAAVAPRTAKVAGTVTPNGAETTYDFEYGATTSYGSQTAKHYAGAGLKGVPVSAAISRLTPGQSYHFRLVATSSSGTTDGSDQTFTTKAAPASPSRA